MKKKDIKKKSLQKIRAKEGFVRDQLLPLNSSKNSENIHKIQLGIGKNHHLSSKLREFSIKSSWVSSEMYNNGRKFVCKLCGKGFKSARAVFGHLRCHSKRKSEAEFEDCSVNEGLLEQELMKQPETPRKKRSGRRYTDKTNCSNSTSWCSLYGSNSAVTDDEELLDIAASLLMLSKGAFYSVDHVSDNNDASVKIEPRLPINSVSNDDNGDDHVAECAAAVDLGSYVDVLRSGGDSVNENRKEFQGFDCGLSLNQPENIEHGPVSDVEIQSDMLLYDAGIKDGTIGVLVDGTLFSNSNAITCVPAAEETKYESVDVSDRMYDESNLRICGPTNHDHVGSGPSVHNEQESVLFDAKISDDTRGVLEADTMVDKLSPNCSDPVIEEKKHEDVGVADQTPDKCNSRASESAMENSSSEKCQKHICSICSKSFLSYQSLGGHRLHCQRLCCLESQAHMNANTSTDITLGEKDGVEDGDNKMKKRWNHDNDKKKRWKKHKCLMCDKDFRSGQALGGHMRAHYQSKDQASEAENVACDKENLADIEEDRKEENDAYDDKILAAVRDLRKQENDVCSNKIQLSLKERQMIIVPQGNIPLMV
ncbi:uncharacterized protein LOC110717322 [Chenopodium quinoa]|uniref:uncharacterized protein LOC110717322 n=1 Tax=Chenopodium quinoa TaxID=63459 RepID=UPI000B791EE5|nr:uncharacterized protein LOC110717322 [Chenopodium quinoa]